MIPRATRRWTAQGTDAWQRAVSAAYFALDTEGEDRRAFRGDLDIWPFGPVDVTRIRCDSVLYRRAPRHLREERESSLLISVPSRSEIRFRQFSREAKCGPGGFVVERSDAPYEFAQMAGDVQWVVKVPTESLTARIGNLQRFVALSVDARQGVASYFLSSLQNATRHLDDLDPAGRESVGQHLLEMLCLALRRDDRVLDSEGSLAQAAHLHRAEEFIRANLKSFDLSPQQVAEACGLSLRYLQRLFSGAEKTVSGHIRACRLARCHEELRNPAGRDSIACIAYRWGFPDQAQFGRHYRSQYGCSPRETRQAAQRERI
ncbi:helix-turn-helix domain-containing protein [Pseudogemmobacter sonorensis]|uniref:AraC-like ligand-binding domain-containing protein n=1 Tax=Pseudogemmobacter sonorensis TaxID=2989681 RepID=UPI00369940AE